MTQDQAIPAELNFPEDKAPEGPESSIQRRLSQDLLEFAQRHFRDELDERMDFFFQAMRIEPEKVPALYEERLMVDIVDWFLFDVPIEGESGLTVTDLFLRRKKLDVSRRARDVLEMFRQATIDAYEVRAVYPGRGVVLRRLADGWEIPVVEMSASRQIRRWDLVACRLWKLDGSYCFSPAIYNFSPKQRETLDVIMTVVREKGSSPDIDPQHLRTALAPLLCRAWLEPVLFPEPREYQNSDGDPIEFCELKVRVADRAAVHAWLLAQQKEGFAENGPDQILWLGKTRTRSEENSLLGTFRWQGNELTLEANSWRRLKKGKTLLKKACGGSLEVIEETRKTIEEAMREAPKEAEGEHRKAERMVPDEMALSIKKSYYENWPDQNIPALKGKTPRQAVTTVKGRQQVARLLKEFEHHERGFLAQGEPGLDFGFLWDTLRLDPEEY